MSDAQDVVAKIDEGIDHSGAWWENRAREAAVCITNLLAKCERMEKVARDLRFAYINKDEDCPHKFETDALAQYEAVFGVHADGNSGGGVIWTEDKPNA